MKSIRHYFGALLYTLLCTVFLSASVSTAFAEEGVKAGVNDLKAVYIFNIIRFTDWPVRTGQKHASGIKLLIPGDDDIFSIMRSIAEKKVAREIGLSVESCATDSCISAASALFIGSGERDDYPRLLDLVAGRPVLTISDIPGFATHGGMIEIRYHNKKLTFVVNLQAVNRSGLYISAQLLQLGEIVGRGHE
ncbi:YfiR family protein [Mariprofundus ferrooxydans]|uniref:YfiR family protein n=1 Tax=Mariprofundus ferrooxydans TaxID=314344 RepID=UPI0014303C0F|nr:YfiR family protein [Mariprofundus ferrooxydans]